jgi:hypothetical protein
MVAMWILVGLAVWLAFAFVVAVFVGRGIRLADERSPGTGVGTVLTTAHLALGR